MEFKISITLIRFDLVVLELIIEVAIAYKKNISTSN